MRQPPRSHRTDGICPCTGRCLSSVGPELAEAVYYFGLVRVCTARSRYVSLPARGPGQAAQALIRQADITPVALVFGRERTGLSNEDLAQCHGAVPIPAVAGFSPLNLACSGERRVGKGRAHTCRYRWSPYPQRQKLALHRCVMSSILKLQQTQKSQ